MKRIVVVVIAAIVVVLSVLTMGTAHAVEPPPVSQPTMGYNTWYAFGANATQGAVLTQAQLIKSRGLQAAGYTTIALDDGWQQRTRDANGSLRQDESKFPNGMTWLGQQLHTMGFKFGIYTAIGSHTCTEKGILPGSFGHYSQDAATFKNWGVNYVKVDNCAGMPGATTETQLTADFAEFGSGITRLGMQYSQELPVVDATGHARVSGSPGWLQAVKASPAFSNQWRTSQDENFKQSAAVTIISHLKNDLNLYANAHWTAQAGHWNDLDMLIPGKTAYPFNWTLTQEQSQLSVWAEEASPLMLSTDIASLTPAEISMLTNPDMLAVDKSGAQAPRGGKLKTYQYLYKGGDGPGHTAVMIANTDTNTSDSPYYGIAIPLSAVGITTPNARVKNVWKGTTVTASRITMTLNPGQATLLILTPGE